MFQSRIDLKDQGQGHQVSNLSETFMFEFKILNDSKVIVFTMNDAYKNTTTKGET